MSVGCMGNGVRVGRGNDNRFCLPRVYILGVQKGMRKLFGGEFQPGSDGCSRYDCFSVGVSATCLPYHFPAPLSLSVADCLCVCV